MPRKVGKSLNNCSKPSWWFFTNHSWNAKGTVGATGSMTFYNILPFTTLNRSSNVRRHVNKCQLHCPDHRTIIHRQRAPLHQCEVVLEAYYQVEVVVLVELEHLQVQILLEPSVFLLHHVVFEAFPGFSVWWLVTLQREQLEEDSLEESSPPLPSLEVPNLHLSPSPPETAETGKNRAPFPTNFTWVFTCYMTLLGDVLNIQQVLSCWSLNMENGKHHFFVTARTTQWLEGKSLHGAIFKPNCQERTDFKDVIECSLARNSNISKRNQCFNKKCGTKKRWNQTYIGWINVKFVIRKENTSGGPFALNTCCNSSSSVAGFWSPLNTGTRLVASALACLPAHGTRHVHVGHALAHRTHSHHLRVHGHAWHSSHALATDANTEGPAAQFFAFEDAAVDRDLKQLQCPDSWLELLQEFYPTFCGSLP